MCKLMHRYDVYVSSLEINAHIKNYQAQVLSKLKLIPS